MGGLTRTGGWLVLIIDFYLSIVTLVFFSFFFLSLFFSFFQNRIWGIPLSCAFGLSLDVFDTSDDIPPRDAGAGIPVDRGVTHRKHVYVGFHEDVV